MNPSFRVRQATLTKYCKKNTKQIKQKKNGYQRRRVGEGSVGGLSENYEGDSDKIVDMRIYR